MDAKESDKDTVLKRIATALERLAGANTPTPPSTEHRVFVWQADALGFQAVTINAIPLKLLKGIDEQCLQLRKNTGRFAQGLPANNALLWGARGAGKSSLVKSVYEDIALSSDNLALIEIHREDLATLPKLLRTIVGDERRFILFCDDLAFDSGETDYKSLKAVLEGGVEGRPDNVIFYATSNRRHLMPREMIENERSTAINPSESVEEKVSLSDRFGLWLGFHSIDQDTYLAMVNAYADHIMLTDVSGKDRAKLERDSLEWAITRGSRSGRVAWQFIIEAAGKSGKRINF